MEKIDEVKETVAEKVDEIKSSKWAEIGKGVIIGVGAVAVCYGISRLVKYAGSVEVAKETVEPVIENAVDDAVEATQEVLDAVA